MILRRYCWYTKQGKASWERWFCCVVVLQNKLFFVCVFVFVENESQPQQELNQISELTKVDLCFFSFYLK
jgi:hypothetical protein